MCTFEVQFFHGFLQKMNAFFVKNCKKTNTLNVQNSVNSTKNCVHLVKNGYDECTKLSKFNENLCTVDIRIV